MAERPLRALTFGDILDQIIALIRDNFRAFVTIAAVAEIPVVAFQMAQLAIVGPSLLDFSALARGEPPPSSGALAFWVGSTFLLAIVGTLGFLLAAAALIHAASERYLGQPISARRSYGAGWRSLWRLILASIICVALWLLVMIAIWVPSIVVSIVRPEPWTIAIAVTLSFAAASVATSYFFVRWSLISPAIVIERAGARRALGRSGELVKGRWWRTFGLLLIAAIGQYMIVSLPATLVSSGLTVAAMLIRPSATYLAAIAGTAIGGLFSIFGLPILPTVLTLIYYDERIRKEGFDLQVLADRLSRGSSPSTDNRS